MLEVIFRAVQLKKTPQSLVLSVVSELYCLKFPPRGITKYLLFFERSCFFFPSSEQPVKCGTVWNMSSMKYCSKTLLAPSHFFPLMQELQNCKYSDILLVQEFVFLSKVNGRLLKEASSCLLSNIVVACKIGKWNIWNAAFILMYGWLLCRLES